MDNVQKVEIKRGEGKRGERGEGREEEFIQKSSYIPPLKS